mmetsp:Transcript_11876/g.18784  ORF Transcript_11876/g.18784 Transcript_11876/m.18784 type:complete len:412 (-) Transcript_11876:387-1622(-)|eukprot:CAMPEP_0169274160 /NCGR_PEP_ID=MMETSP1016-20121227/51557_1 /TAXON_ID=342587 /ORGANISM="Karlodinium micrum, Strain CCMP2283" /LENGTH=411 /DNA_ID=CAMNT_0009360663 /DNA_START=13 /DNA_END=1248 /DNA_ORIENTATION=-
MTLPVGFMTLLLSVLPSDRRAIRWLTVFSLMILLIELGVQMYGAVLWIVESVGSEEKTAVGAKFAGMDIPHWIWKCEIFRMCMYHSLLVCLALVLAWTFRFSHIKQLRRVWKLNATFWICESILNSLAPAIIYTAGGYPAEHLLLQIVAAVFMILTAYFGSRKSFRIRAQAWLGSWGETDVTAAGIAELLGQTDVRTILARAVDSFYFVSAEKLTREDMADRMPNPDLQRFIEKGKLGHVDAFLSHSWHDDEAQKWEALQTWRLEFKKEFRREPRLWIDKYCIDQSRIEHSLACLPVYLAGCRKLLVLQGRTYVRRLWCIMELYVFHAVDRPAEDVEVRTLACTDDAKELMRRDVEMFWIGNATCGLREDTDRLVAAMEAATSDMYDFVEFMKGVLLCSMRHSEVVSPRAT